MTVADRLARFNRRLPNRVIGKIAGRRLSPVAFMLHQGRRSGRQYRTPVMPLPLRDGFLVSLPYVPRRDWVRNVLAAGRFGFEDRSGRLELDSPQVVSDPSRRLVPWQVRLPLRLIRTKEFLVMRIVSEG